jgi:hypothetical protein
VGLFTAMIAVSLGACAGEPSAAYIRSTVGSPWDTTNNETAMNRVFGSGNWKDLRFETVEVTNLLSTNRTFIFMEGSQFNATEMEAFLTNHIGAIENWVSAGGRLFLNAAPSEDDGMSFGFGVTLSYFDYTTSAAAVDTNHPILRGPFRPVGTAWSGDGVGHGSVSGSDLVGLITNTKNGLIVLGEKNVGLGHVFFGGMTPDSYQSPQVEAANLRANILAFGRPPATLVTDRDTVAVPEGGGTNFQVKLSCPPASNAAVTVERSAGDADITVTGGDALAFTADTWNTWQTVTLAAAEEDGDNLNGSATISCKATGLSEAIVAAVEEDDDYTLTVTASNGTVSLDPDRALYDRGMPVTLTATPDPSYAFKGWTGDLTNSANPLHLAMVGDVSITAVFGLVSPGILPPRTIGKKSFTARWTWVEKGAPEGEISVAADAAFATPVTGYAVRYVINRSECLVTNLLAGHDYWYRVRRVMPDARVSNWSPSMKVHTGTGMPVFKNLLSEAPAAKGVNQEFALSGLASGSGSLAVKSSDPTAVAAAISNGVLTLRYVWKGAAPSARLTLTLTHPGTGYKAAYATVVSRSTGGVSIVGTSALTNAGESVAQAVTLENRTGRMAYGLRLRAGGLDNPDWLISRTGLDPVSHAAIVELPCVWPAGSQAVVRLVYNNAYKKQARTRPVTYRAWAVLPPIGEDPLETGTMAISQRDAYDGLWLLGLPASRNRYYAVYQSDNDGASWTMNAPTIRATANFLMWLDTDPAAPTNRLYRVKDNGM